MPFERIKFNTDPKHQTEREQFDAMTEDSINRIIEKKAGEMKKPKPAIGFFESIFTTGDGEENLFDSMFGRNK